MHLDDKSAIRLWLIVSFLISVIFPSYLHAQSTDVLPPEIPPQIEWTVSVDRPTYRVDEEIPFRLMIRWREKATDIRCRLSSLPLENLKVLEATESAETRWEGQNEIRERVFSYRLKPVKVGPASIGSFFLEYGLPNAANLKQVRIPSYVFEIKPAPQTARQLLRLLSMLAAVAILCTFVVVIRNNVIWKDYDESKRGEQSFEEECLAKLTGMNHLFDAQHTKDYIIRSGDILRDYLKHKFQVNVTGLSGLELYDWIERRRDIPSDEKRKIRAMIERLSECQFAGMEPDFEEVKEINRQIAEFITQQKVI